ncbi:MAG: DUF2254 family protein [Methanosarcinaceae archaeon]
MAVEFKKKLHTLTSNLTNNYIFFIFFTIFLLIGSLITYFSYHLSQGSADSARYFFSSVAQSQAAIIAIVITITLVAVQLSAQTYTPRAIDVFINSKAFWSLLTVYAASIVYDVSVLPLIPPTFSEIPVTGLIDLFSIRQLTLRTSLDDLILIGLILFILTFLVLFLFIKDIAKQLKPDKIVEKLAKDIDINLLTMTIENGNHEVYMLPLTDICRKSIELRDDSLALKVVSELKSISETVIDNRNFVKIEKTHKLKEFDKYLSNQDRDIDTQVISHFEGIFSDLAYSSLEKGSFIVFDSIMDSLGNIGVNVCKKESNEAISLLITLKEMDKIVQEKYSKNDSLRAIRNFKVVSLSSVDNELWDVIEYSLGIFKRYVYGYESKNLERTDEDLIYEIEIGRFQRPLFIVDSIITIALSIIKKMPDLGGSTSIKNSDGSVDYIAIFVEIENALSHLKAMADISIRNDWKMVTNSCVDGIIDIGTNLISKGGENLHHPINPTKLLSQHLQEIATSSTHQAVYEKTKDIVNTLEDKSKDLAMRESKNVSYTVESLIDIYQFVYSNHCKQFPCSMIEGVSDSLGSIGKITMENDFKFLTEDELRIIEKQSHRNSQMPVTQKIVDKIVEMGINASKRGSRWEYMAKQAVRYLIIFTTYYAKKGNDEVTKYLIQKIHNMGKSSDVKLLISKILEEIEDNKNFGITESYYEDGFSKYSKLEMDDEDFKTFLKIKSNFDVP